MHVRNRIRGAALFAVLLLVAWRSAAAARDLWREARLFDAARLAEGWSMPMEDRVRATLAAAYVQGTPEEDRAAIDEADMYAAQDAYELIRDEVGAGEVVYFIARPNGRNARLFVRLQALSYPRVLHPIRSTATGWEPSRAPAGRAVYALELGAEEPGLAAPDFSPVAVRGDCKLLRFRSE